MALDRSAGRLLLLALAFGSTAPANGQQNEWIGIDSAPTGYVVKVSFDPNTTNLGSDAVTEIDVPPPSNTTYYLEVLDTTKNTLGLTCTLGTNWKITVDLKNGGSLTIVPPIPANLNQVTKVSGSDSSNNAYQFTPAASFPEDQTAWSVTNFTPDQNTSLKVAMGSCNGTTVSLSSPVLITTKQPPAARKKPSVGLYSIKDPPIGMSIRASSLAFSSPKKVHDGPDPSHFVCDPQRRTATQMVAGQKVTVWRVNKISDPYPTRFEDLLQGIADWKITAYPQQLEITVESGNTVKFSALEDKSLVCNNTNPALGYFLRVVDPSNQADTVRPRAFSVEWVTGGWFFRTRHSLSVPCESCSFLVGFGK